MGTNPKVCFLGGMGGRSLVVSQSRKVGIFFILQGIFFFVVWDGVVGEREWVYFVFVFFFLLRYGDLMIFFFKKIFYKNK
jgi:hypothetical protein